jgi:DNA-binding response OmpR family regulator
LKSELEQNGCQVDLVDPKLDDLPTVGQRYFEAIILEIEKHPKRAFKTYKQLKALPELADLPLILLGTCDDPKRFLNRLGSGLIYYVAKEKTAALPVWQLVKQIHYLTSRYLPLSVN